MTKIGKTLKNLLYAIPIIASTVLPGCEPDPEIIDNIPPKINRYSPLEGKVYKTNTVPLEYAINEDNFKEAWYSINSGIKQALSKSGTKNLNLVNGNYKIVIDAKDLYENSSKDSVNFSVDKPIEPTDTVAPKINITSPLEDIVYNTNDISLEWNIEEENFKNAWYIVNGGAKQTLSKSGTKNLNLVNGDYKIVLGAEDLSANASKDSVNFSVDKHSWIYLVNLPASTNPNGAEYDLLNTKAQRDSLFQADLFEDWADAYHVPYHADPLWDCTQWSNQLCINFHEFPDLTGYAGDYLPLDTLYKYGYTLKDNGKRGLPVYNVIIPAGNHEMNAIFTGYDATKFEDWNFIEPQFDQMNVQPGQAYMPMNCEVVINYSYVNQSDHLLDGFPILKFQITNGVPSFIWKNPDPNLNIITQRKK